jgi:hypothetical protein
MNRTNPELVIGALAATAIWSVVGLFSGPQTINVKDISAPAATIFAGLAAGSVACTIGRSQISVAKLQADVALRNWQTSNEKIVLELFERRLLIFEGIRQVVAEVVRTGRPTNETYFSYVKAVDKATYFFGTEVIEYLEELRILIINLQLDADVIADNLNPERTAHIKGKVERMKQLVKFYETAKLLFGPYMQAHQKA